LQAPIPLKAAIDAGAPVQTPHDPGFVSGVGYGCVLPEMWPLASSMIQSVIIVSLAEVATGIRIMAERNRNRG